LGTEVLRQLAGEPEVAAAEGLRKGRRSSAIGACDDRLIGEDLEQINLLIGQRANLVATSLNVAKKRNRVAIGP
jgi:hypothetical protein